ncbi:uncharacterized protein LOC127702299 [Mytilus californianus]|uniref:uncharacterized protein LOC127702299 n=1 Tax=Mytilus californianus TaxID=6549 RepID=UPI0022455893|nr:uncharacterized protein LOC127702299 [Mytilus californianus]XP_052062399.1 uncharacterized protein LOC127702299 [Mytilus californianus]
MISRTCRRYTRRRCLRLLCLLCLMYVAFTYVSGYLVQRNVLEFYSKPDECMRLKNCENEKGRPMGLNSKENISTNGKLQSFQKLEYVETSDSRVYMLSAYFIKKMEEQKDNIVTVIGWEEKKNHFSKFKCCFRLQKGKRMVIKSKKWYIYSYPNSLLRRVQFTCPISTESKSIEGVSIITDFKRTCHKESKYYIQVQTPLQGELAVCTTVLYGSLSAELLLEWFEVQRIIGVEKTVTYTFELNKDAMKICEYYESIGFTVLVRVADFPAREKHVRFLSRGDQNDKVWTDQQVFALDCHTRMHGYKYVIGIDRDEFVLPNIRKYGLSLRRVLDQIFDHSTAGVIMKPNMHVTTWKPFNQSSSLFITKYLKATNPVWDREKYAHMPNRTHIGSPSLHDFKPNKGFKWYTPSTSDITLHHYRSCQKIWWKLVKSDTNVVNDKYSIQNEDDLAVSTCQYFRQYQQKDIEIIGQHIEPRVLKLRHMLNIKN